jgi:hypothetical protein
MTPSNQSTSIFGPPVGQGITDGSQAGSFLLPMIKPMNLQRSWTSVVSRAVYFFFRELSAYSTQTEKYWEEVHTA